MKLYLSFVAVLSVILQSADAFLNANLARIKSCQSTLTALRSADSDAVEDALDASKKFGPTSKEARVAWDIVEEIRARDNSAAFKSKDSHALDNPTKNKEMYEKFLELQTLGEHQRLQAETAKYVTNHIRAVKLAPPEKLASKERLHNPILDHALSEAKTMTKLHGATSKEAKLAWEAVEQISSNDSSEVMKVSIDAVDGECLVEMIEACEAMEELNRALFLNENKEVGRYQG